MVGALGLYPIGCGFKSHPEYHLKGDKQMKLKLDLTGEDGNAFVLLGKARRAARKAGWSKTQIEWLTDQATKGDYDHLLQELMKRFDVT